MGDINTIDYNSTMVSSTSMVYDFSTKNFPFYLCFKNYTDTSQVLCHDDDS